jgi:PAS domain S-box-containing protein
VRLAAGDVAHRERPSPHDAELEMRELEQRLIASEAYARASHEHLRLFVEHAPAAVAMFDMQMRYLLVSRRWMDDYRLGDQNIIGRTHYEIFPEIPERWKEAHRRCLAGETLSADEDFFERQDGSVDWTRWELLPWRRADGEIGGMIMCTEVITERRAVKLALLESHRELEDRVAARTRALEAAKAEADRANAFKSRFLATVNHDMRQPLYAAGMYLSVLGRQLDDPNLIDLLGRTRQSLAVMGDMLDALLDLSQMERGSIKPTPCSFAITDLLERVVTNHELQIKQKGLTLKVAHCRCTIRSDPALLERVVDNLVSNAVRYTESGEIEVGCVRGDGFLDISVRDTGIGIPEEALQGIFDEYVQLDNPARERAKGLGLGLSIAKYIADALGHSLQVRSSVGVGSTFTIRVPQTVAPPRISDAVPPTETALGHRPVVVVVEDDPAISVSTLMLLEAEGFEAHEASAGEQALALLAAGIRPEAIISDHRLPGYDGFEVVRRVRKVMQARIPAIVITGDTALQMPPASALGDCELLYKPTQPEALAAAVRRILASQPPVLEH